MELGRRIQALMTSGRGGGKMKATISVDTQIYRQAQATAGILGSGISEVIEAMLADWLEAVQTTSIVSPDQKILIDKALKKVVAEITEEELEYAAQEELHNRS